MSFSDDTAVCVLASVEGSRWVAVTQGWLLWSRVILQHAIQRLLPFLIQVFQVITHRPLSVLSNTLLSFSHCQLTS